MEKKVKKLIIKKPGIYLNIPGLPLFRSPGELDISRVDLKLVLGELTKNGISKYKIEEKIIVISQVEYTGNKKIKSENKNKSYDELLEKISNIPSSDNSEILEKISKQQNTIDKISNLLERFLNSDFQNKVKDPVVSKKKEINKIDDDLDEFIPKIEIGKLKINKSFEK